MIPLFFFFKQKTAYEMRISDWSSDVCSSDLYVERIDVNGNTLTQDKVVRREFRLNEGDAFNSFAVKRTESRINSLGYFQENLEVERKEGSAPDRIILETNEIGRAHV